jgi:CRISPR/Cas system CSM-associated protein Csm3 (group 7 of RAMP superfamily)
MTRATDPTTPATPAAPADARAATVTTPAGIRAAPARVQRDGLFPLWRLSGRITLRTPLHLGSGRDEAITLPDRPGRDAAPAAAPAAAGDTEAHTDRHVAAVARDHRGHPCIPASSFKGALAALARRAGLPQDLQARLFGAEEGDLGGVQAAGAAAASTRAGLVEFVTLYADPTSLPPDSPLPDFATEGHPHVAHLPHVSRNRHSGAAEHQRLYLQSVLPPGVQFQFECTARGAGLTEDDITTLLGLLALAGDDASPLRLGAGQAADQGRIGWSAAQVQRIDGAAALWTLLAGPASAAATAPPSPPASTPPKPRPGQLVYSTAQLKSHGAARPAPQAPTSVAVPTAARLQPKNLWSHPGLAPVQTRLRAAALSLPSSAWLSLPGLQLRFHSPFLVYQANTRKKAGSGEPDGLPRRDHQGRGLLPAHSLHGALRAQAERILRTVGQPAAAGYEVPGVNGLADLAHRLGRDELDLATLLFGAPGWRALLRCSDFVDEQGCATPVQHLLAIDRLTGGGKDSAKFAVQVLDCPTLTGRLELDLQRLARVEARCPGSSARALGLLAHVLRDLDDGDIPLGYGASKGWGQSTSDWAARLARALQSGPAHLPHDSGLPTLPEALAAWAAALPPAPDTPQGAGLAAAAAQTAPTPPQTPALPLPPAGAAEAEPDRFHNPYVFIPFPTPRPDDPHLPWADADALREGRAAHHSHARYAADALHGELRCRLTTTTPVFIGAGDADAALQKPNAPALKAPYRLGGQLAIPATSLRGLLSSLHESLTASRLRAAGDRRDSVRWTTDMQLQDSPGGGSAIGRLLKLEGRPGLWLQMLALPVLELPRERAGQEAAEWRIDIPPSYRFLAAPGQAAPLKSLFGDRATRLDGLFAKDPAPTNMPLQAGLEDRAKLRISSGSSPGQLQILVDVRRAAAELHIKDPGRGPRFLLGERRRVDERPVVAQTGPDGRKSLPAGYRPGLLRVMRDDKRDLPTGKTPQEGRRHEVFVPFGRDQVEMRQRAEQWLRDAAAAGRSVSDDELTRTFHILPVPDSVLTRFCELADTVTASQDNQPDLAPQQWRPYHPLGQRRNEGAPTRLYGGLAPRNAERALRPKPNDLVYFRPAEDGRSIAEISYSNLWRRALNSSIAELLADTPGALPDTALMADPKRPPQRLSPSELLFGTVEVRSPGDGRRPLNTANDPSSAQDPILAWMGKLRPSAALPLTEGDQRCDGEVTLKILSSPKPPSPSMYFQPRPGRRAESTPTKADLWFKPGDYQLRGRKAYLHALRDADLRVRPLDSRGRPDPAGKAPWESHRPSDPQTVKQKVRVTPLAAGNRFEFSLRFANLSRAELESLCAALRPTEHFEHKIGMGKPIGLGSVKIDFTGLKLSDRAVRYRQTDFTATAALIPLGESAATAQTLAQCHMSRLQKTDPAVVRALQLIGDPAQVQYPVHYPQKAGKDIETENYGWFVDNDKVTQQLRRETRQSLEALDARSTGLRGLSRRPRSG